MLLNPSTLHRWQGNITVNGRESPKSLYSADLASMEIEGGGSIDYEPADAQVGNVRFCNRRVGGTLRLSCLRLHAVQCSLFYLNILIGHYCAVSGLWEARVVATKKPRIARD